MAISVEGKTALITGAGSGINLKFALLLLDQGCSVVVADLRLSPAAETALKPYLEADSSSGKASALFHKTDVTSWPQLSALWDAALARYGTVDIVVPGAGLFEPAWASFWAPPKTASNPNSASREPADAEPGHYAVLDVNVTHPIRLSQIAIAHWLERKAKGTLVHVSSMAGYTTALPTPLYFASKHALTGFVRSLGHMRDRLGIRVGCVAPGPVNTPMLHDDPTKSKLLDPVTELVEPEEVAAGMMKLVVDEELGNGTVLECSKDAYRTVPEFNMTPPSGRGTILPGYYASIESLCQDLESGSMKT